MRPGVGFAMAREEAQESTHGDDMDEYHYSVPYIQYHGKDDLMT